MSDYGKRFVDYLTQLDQDKRDRVALAVLRRSLAFEPGSYAPAFRYVEHFVPQAAHWNDSSRSALYIVASLFAIYPHHAQTRFAAVLGHLGVEQRRAHGSTGIERRFISLLGADPENVHVYLRHAVTLLASAARGSDRSAFDYGALFDDLCRWLDRRPDPDRRDKVRQMWARDFYRVFAPVDTANPESATDSSSSLSDD